VQEFYPFYLSQHINPICRLLHFIGTTLVMVVVAVIAITKDLSYLPLCPLVGYGFAWVGHFFFEKNKPATFTYPRYSLICDFIMWKDIIVNQKLMFQHK